VLEAYFKQYSACFGNAKPKFKPIVPQTNKTKLGLVVLTCHPSYKGCINKRLKSEAAQGKNTRPYLKNN
jgi:hypothetical protein